MVTQGLTKSQVRGVRGFLWGRLDGMTRKGSWVQVPHGPPGRIGREGPGAGGGAKPHHARGHGAAATGKSRGAGRERTAAFAILTRENGGPVVSSCNVAARIPFSCLGSCGSLDRYRHSLSEV